MFLVSSAGQQTSIIEHLKNIPEGGADTWIDVAADEWIPRVFPDRRR